MESYTKSPNQTISMSARVSGTLARLSEGGKRQHSRDRWIHFTSPKRELGSLCGDQRDLDDAVSRCHWGVQL